MRQVEFKSEDICAMTDNSTFGVTLTQVINGYLLSAALFAAVDMDLFNHIAEWPLKRDELARRIGVSVQYLHRLLRVLDGLGLVTVTDGDRIALTDTSRESLVDGAPESMLAAIRHHHHHAYWALGNLGLSMRTGQPNCGAVGDDLYTMLDRDSDASTFIEAMNGFSKQVGRRIIELVDLQDVGTILDLGGGGGQIAHELLVSLPNVEVVLADREPILKIARARWSELYPDRLRYLEHEFQQDTFTRERADVVLLSAVLGDWDGYWRSRIFRSAWAATRPGGKLLISETILDDDQRGPAGALLLNLYVLTLTQGGDNLTEHEWREFLKKEGVQTFEVVRDGSNGFRDLIVCHKLREGKIGE